tara:strand:- start:157 stop:708 length:552 start_codon:yes stop_codon:yes gene_type:complete
VDRYYYLTNAIAEKDCDNFLSQYSNNKFEEAKTGDTATREEQREYRQSEVQWLQPNNVIVRAIWSYVIDINTQHFKVNLTGYEGVQFTKYKANGDNYKWHKDTLEKHDKTQRKLSVVVQLSKPEDYKGGELQLFNGMKEPEELPIKNQGSLIVFKSEEWHQVTPVVEGTRYSIVMWVNGPAYV